MHKYWICSWRVYWTAATEGKTLVTVCQLEKREWVVYLSANCMWPSWDILQQTSLIINTKLESLSLFSSSIFLMLPYHILIIEIQAERMRNSSAVRRLSHPLPSAVWLYLGSPVRCVSFPLMTLWTHCTDLLCLVSCQHVISSDCVSPLPRPLAPQ